MIQMAIIYRGGGVDHQIFPISHYIARGMVGTFLIFVCQFKPSGKKIKSTKKRTRNYLAPLFPKTGKI